MLFVQLLTYIDEIALSPTYLDCNATTPIDPDVRETLLHYLIEEFGNEGSRTHEYGARAKHAVQRARDQVAAVVGAKREEVIFTSGATESNNLAILGLREAARKTGRTHFITSMIEHKAVLEPFDALEREGVSVTRLPVCQGGFVQPNLLADALRPDTFLVSLMQANNETGILQPLAEIAEVLANHDTYLHTDAAQGFGKDVDTLINPRIDMISVSGHKIFAPKGVGALIIRRRGYERLPLTPLFFGGGQERGLRPGTLPVALIAALGMAAELAVRNHDARHRRCVAIRAEALAAFESLNPTYSGDLARVMPHVLNVAFSGLDSEALIVALKDLIAISNGSACTSSSYTPSHVLNAMGMTDDQANACVRISWCHLTPGVDWAAVVKRIHSLR